MDAAIAALPPKTRDVLMQLIKDVLADGVVTPDEEQALVQFAVAAGMKPMPEPMPGAGFIGGVLKKLAARRSRFHPGCKPSTT